MRQGGGNTANAWEQEWRSGVMSQLGEIADKQESAALILERLTNRFDEHDRRITALEGLPARQQSTLFGVTGLGINAVFAVIALVSLAISLGSHLSFH